MKAILVAVLAIVLLATVVYAEDCGGYVKPGTIVVTRDIWGKTVGGGDGGSPALNFVSDGGKTVGGGIDGSICVMDIGGKTVGGEGGNICYYSPPKSVISTEAIGG